MNNQCPWGLAELNRMIREGEAAARCCAKIAMLHRMAKLTALHNLNQLASILKGLGKTISYSDLFGELELALPCREEEQKAFRGVLAQVTSCGGDEDAHRKLHRAVEDIYKRMLSPAANGYVLTTQVALLLVQMQLEFGALDDFTRLLCSNVVPIARMEDQ